MAIEHSNRSHSEAPLQLETYGDHILESLFQQREGILALAMVSMKVRMGIPEVLSKDLSDVSLQITERLAKVKDLVIRSEATGVRLDMLIEDDDLREAAEADPENTDLVEGYKDFHQYIRDRYGFTDEA